MAENTKKSRGNLAQRIQKRGVVSVVLLSFVSVLTKWVTWRREILGHRAKGGVAIEREDTLGSQENVKYKDE